MDRSDGSSGTGARMFLVVAAMVAMGAASTGPASTQPLTTRVSVDPSQGDSNGPSSYPAVSGDGRFVAFGSSASNLVEDDGNGLADVFLRDMQIGVIRRVSTDVAGGDANGSSFDAAITPDGRFVAFDSEASDLVPGDTNGMFDVFIRDMATGGIQPVSVATTGESGNNDSYSPSISANGRFVAFWSVASNLVPNDNNHVWDIFVRDMVTGQTRRVSVARDGGDPDLDSEFPSISATGRYVAFTSAATNLVRGDGNGAFDVFVRDTARGVTTRVSRDVIGGDPDGSSHGAAVSADGRYVAFYSVATDLVPDDENFLLDVFRRDMASATTTRVSVDVGGGDANGSSFDPAISANGRYVSYRSAASDLVTADDNGHQDVFLRDAVGATTSRVSVDVNGGDADGISYSYAGAVSSSGSYVAFWSFAADLVSGDGNDMSDVFIRSMS